MSISQANRRILVIDDNLSIHDDFKRILIPVTTVDDLDAEAAAFLGEAVAPKGAASGMFPFEIETASQGQEGLAKVLAARAAGKPYAMAFVDMRMPPGWDGLTTIVKLWENDPHLLAVICTAHCERSWDEIAGVLTTRDRWAVLKKPFDKIEVLQLAHVMTEKWNLAQAAGIAPRPLGPAAVAGLTQSPFQPVSA
jgi:CheY-like chemotaxis protein